MKKTYVQFACDPNTIEALKYIAFQKKITLTALCQDIVVNYLEDFIDVPFQEEGNSITKKTEVFYNG